MMEIGTMEKATYREQTRSKKGTPEGLHKQTTIIEWSCEKLSESSRTDVICFCCKWGRWKTKAIKRTKGNKPVVWWKILYEMVCF